MIFSHSIFYGGLWDCCREEANEHYIRSKKKKRTQENRLASDQRPRTLQRQQRDPLLGPLDVYAWQSRDRADRENEVIIFAHCRWGLRSCAIASLLQQRTPEPRSLALVVVYWHTPFWLLLNACRLQIHHHTQFHSLPDHAERIAQLYRRKQSFRGVSGWRMEGLHAVVVRAVVAG